MRCWYFLLLLVIPFLSGCSSATSGSSNALSFDPGCITVRSYPGGVTLTGVANYEFRVNGNGAVNSAVAVPNLPIRQAQVSVYNSINALVQCGVTDDSGNFSVTVPQTAENYTVSVDSRIYDAMTKAAVFNNPTQMSVHSITQTVSGAASASIGTMTATATGAIKGGAFNILDKIYGANIYMRDNTANCSGMFSGCTPFTAAPPVFIFWDRGVNPGDYFSAGALSFYLPGQSELYILGGINGNTDSSDCDHFDNSIILHEYGHFIEDVFADTDSPGGSHNGNSIIDARLAWGEGWANFYQGAILNLPVYRDTAGNVDGVSTSVFFNESLETGVLDIPTAMGQGNFREFSISRLLWDTIDGANDDAVNGDSSDFAELWTVFTSSTVGLKNTSRVFRNVGLFHELQQALPNNTDWSTLRNSENQLGNQNDYARTLAATGAICNVTIQAANMSMGSPENGSAARSNQFASNDFYRYYHPGGAFTFQLNTVAPTADLDLYIFRNGYRFSDTSSSSLAASSLSSVAGATETVSTSLAAGWYMINVRVDTLNGLGTATDYNMFLNGARLCPN